MELSNIIEDISAQTINILGKYLWSGIHFDGHVEYDGLVEGGYPTKPSSI